MSAPMPFGQPLAPGPASTPTDSIQRIEQTTTDLLYWVKILTIVMILLLLVNVAFLFA